jgi:ABC-2 type transport system ATP-binding protein
VSGLVEVRAVSKRYGATLAVDNVSLMVNAGEIYALVGPNGAGKSTLIRSIVGITVPDAGEISICEVDSRKNVSKAKSHIGYLPEELIFYDRLSASEYLELVAGLKETDRLQIPEVLDFFELESVAAKWIGSYSLGMRKKLGLAAAMLGAPRVLVLDEPLNGLDVEMMRKLRNRLTLERNAGRALLISSHVMDFVERTADRVGIMSKGRIVAEDSPRALREKAGLYDASFEDVFFHFASGSI